MEENSRGEHLYVAFFIHGGNRKRCSIPARKGFHALEMAVFNGL